MERLIINGPLPKEVNVPWLLETLTLGRCGLHPELPFNSRTTLLMNGQIYNIEYSNPHHTLTVAQVECSGLVFDGQNWVPKR